MLYVITAYWPFLFLAIILGMAIGWWYQDLRSADDATAWLEPGRDDL